MIARLLIAGLCGASAIAAHADNIGRNVYGFYSESFPGMKFDQQNPGAGGSDGGYMGFWGNGTLSTTTAPSPGRGGDGAEAIQVYDNGTSAQAGVFIQFGFVSTSPLTTPEIATNMSAYENGVYRFSIRATHEVAVTIKDNNGYAQAYLNENMGVSLDNQWHEVTVPLSTGYWPTYKNDTDIPTGSLLNFSAIKNIAFGTKWTTARGTARTFAVDNIKWIKSNTTVSFSAALKQTGTHASANSISWSNITLGSTKWKAADQYIELNIDSYMNSWGIQIYTDNAVAGVSPQYRGAGNPAGLVGQLLNGGIDPSSTTLAMCWRITDSTVTVPNIQQGAAGFADRLWDANVTLNGDQFPCFFWIKDKRTAGFVNADDYMTVWDTRGIHYAEGESWGTRCYAPNYIYLGANFSYAIGARIYKTSRLFVELFGE